MAKRLDWESMIGKIYGKWLVLDVLKERNNNGKIQLLCECTCELKKQKVVDGGTLMRGQSTSCGCHQKVMVRSAKTKHSMSSHTLYITWMNIRQRCSNKNKRDYKWYGGSGISVCEEWDSDFMAFYNWAIKNGWKEGLEVDRIDNNGNYCPENCNWITQEQNKEIGKRRLSSTNTTGYCGVYPFKESGKYIATLTHDNKKYYLGIFEHIKDAVEARINKEIEIFGEQRTNFNYNSEKEN